MRLSAKCSVWTQTHPGNAEWIFAPALLFRERSIFSSSFLPPFVLAPQSSAFSVNCACVSSLLEVVWLMNNRKRCVLCFLDCRLRPNYPSCWSKAASCLRRVTDAVFQLRKSHHFTCFQRETFCAARIQITESLSFSGFSETGRNKTTLMFISLPPLLDPHRLFASSCYWRI